MAADRRFHSVWIDNCTGIQQVDGGDRVRAIGHWGAVVTPECPAFTLNVPRPAVAYRATGHGLLMKSGAHTGTPVGTVSGPLHGGLGGSKP